MVPWFPCIFSEISRDVVCSRFEGPPVPLLCLVEFETLCGKVRFCYALTHFYSVVFLYKFEKKDRNKAGWIKTQRYAYLSSCKCYCAREYSTLYTCCWAGYQVHRVALSWPAIEPIWIFSCVFFCFGIVYISSLFKIKKITWSFSFYPPDTTAKSIINHVKPMWNYVMGICGADG